MKKGGMRPGFFRATALIVAAALFAAPVCAQDAGDPPGRVGRLARIEGTVSFHTADQNQWQQAVLNYPVTSGYSFWTEPNSGAAIDVGGTRIAMAPSTELDVETLNDQMLVATLPQGEAYLRVPALPPGGSMVLRTPRGLVTIAQPGRYAVNAGDAGQPTLVTVVDGQASLASGGATTLVSPGQTAMVTGSDPFETQLGPQAADPFLTAQLTRERPAATPPAAAQPPAAVLQMTGGEALAETGRWAPSPEYGQVWYPPVQQGWVPYRDGHWAYVEPWGWTWVDDAPWGFAPSHYGRWVDTPTGWGWVAGVPEYETGIVAPPIYAPALVTFLGGLAVGAAVGAIASQPVGWVPLGPREPYFPPYRVGPGYVRGMNMRQVNITNFNQTVRTTNFINRGGATMVPGTAMIGSQPIGRQARPVPPQMLAAARPEGAAPIRPGPATLGVTPGVARQLNLPGGPAPRPPAPRLPPGGSSSTRVSLRGGVVGRGAPRE